MIEQEDLLKNTTVYRLSPKAMTSTKEISVQKGAIVINVR